MTLAYLRQRKKTYMDGMNGGGGMERGEVWEVGLGEKKVEREGGRGRWEAETTQAPAWGSSCRT